MDLMATVRYVERKEIKVRKKIKDFLYINSRLVVMYTKEARGLRWSASRKACGGHGAQ
jgi:hypothetical protein